MDIVLVECAQSATSKACRSSKRPPARGTSAATTRYVHLTLVLHQHSRRAQDETDAAQRARSARHRHQPDILCGPTVPDQTSSGRSAVLRRGKKRRSSRRRTSRRFTRSAVLAAEGPDRIVLKHLHLPQPSAACSRGRSSSIASSIPGRDQFTWSGEMRRLRGFVEPQRGALS